jgi:hypothetical protein
MKGKRYVNGEKRDKELKLMMIQKFHFEFLDSYSVDISSLSPSRTLALPFIKNSTNAVKNPNSREMRENKRLGGRTADQVDRSTPVLFFLD